MEYYIKGSDERNQAYPHEFKCPICSETVWFKNALVEAMKHMGYSKGVTHPECYNEHYNIKEDE